MLCRLWQGGVLAATRRFSGGAVAPVFDIFETWLNQLNKDWLNRRRALTASFVRSGLSICGAKAQADLSSKPWRRNRSLPYMGRYLVPHFNGQAF